MPEPMKTAKFLVSASTIQRTPLSYPVPTHEVEVPLKTWQNKPPRIICPHSRGQSIHARGG